ncbi:MAG: histidine kinase [Telluria sp.]
MKLFHAGWRGLRRAGSVIYQGNDLSVHSGVWITRISREALVVQVLLMVAMAASNLLLWWSAGRTGKHWTGAVLVFCVVLIGLVSTMLAHALDKHPDRPPSTKVFATWAGLIALLGLPLGHLVFFFAQQVQPIKMTPFLHFFPEFVVALVAAFSYWRLVIIRLWHERLATEELKRHTAEQGQALAEARLHMLKAQIEPHFLFNTLASVQHLVRTDPVQADFLLSQLISYLRQAIPDVRGTASTLEREFLSIQTYLEIVRVRMGGRLAVTVACEPALAQVPFPSLIIHTLVENAIKHGIEMKTGPVSIAVLARAVDHGAQQEIAISVEDDGVGFGAAETIGGGVGLRNVRDRLALAYDGRARLDISDSPGGGVCATVSIPRSQV